MKEIIFLPKRELDENDRRLIGFCSEAIDSHLDDDITESGCIGFGVERWVLAFRTQFGITINEWSTVFEQNEIKSCWKNRKEQF
jgi:hypothetical protein